VRAWTRAGREVAKLRVEARMRARERSQIQYALGGACFEGDEAQVENLRDQMRICTERIDECAAEAKQVLEGARTRTSNERRSFARTQIRPPS
jgi:hypothetical protein